MIDHLSICASAPVLPSTVAAISWAVFFLLAVPVAVPSRVARIVGVLGVCGAMTACSTGAIAITQVAETKVDQAVQLAANLERSAELLKAIELQQPPPPGRSTLIITGPDGQQHEIDRSIFTIARNAARRSNAD